MPEIEMKMRNEIVHYEGEGNLKVNMSMSKAPWYYFDLILRGDVAKEIFIARKCHES